MNLISILKLQNSIISRYLIRNIIAILLAVFVVIGVIIFGNQLVLVVKDSLEAGIPISDLIPLVAFNMIRDIPLILSLSFFLSIIIAINRLYKDSEAIVMNSMGIGDKSFMLAIQPLTLVIFFIVLYLTTVAIPWSKTQRSAIMDRSENASEFSFIKQSEFQEFKNGEIVFYASKANNLVESNGQDMEDIFIYTQENASNVITLASKAHKYTEQKTNNVYLRLIDGKRYYNFPSKGSQKVLKFDLYDLQIIDGDIVTSTGGYESIDGKPTLELLKVAGPREILELQWRLSQPISILVLSFLGVLLGKSSPRGGKNLGLLIGVAMFILYNNTILLAKSSIEKGDIPLFFGLWWVHVALLMIILIFYLYRHRKLAQYVDKITHHFISKG